MGFTVLFGGTFNPFHIGHLAMLRALENDESVEEIFIMPDKIPPHKICSFLADDQTRIKMCEIAAEDFSKAKVCLIEFQREGKSYTYDTIIRLKQKYPDKKFAFACGGDMLVSFDTWHQYEKLACMLPFYVFRRKDTDNDLFDHCVEKFKKIGMKIKVMKEIIPDVSSSSIRSDFATAKEMLPEKIFEFLKKRGVYDE